MSTSTRDKSVGRIPEKNIGPAMRNPNDGSYHFALFPATHDDVFASLKAERIDPKNWDKGFITNRYNFVKK